jgi:hypothetical protein
MHEKCQQLHPVRKVLSAASGFELILPFALLLSLLHGACAL